MAISRGFHGNRPTTFDASRVPPGQYVTTEFPVLSAGPTPQIPLNTWSFTVDDDIMGDPASWTWEEFRALPTDEVIVDLHCVTKWTKLGTRWRGVSLDTLIGARKTPATHALVIAEGGYSANVPLADLLGGKAWIAFEYDGAPLEPQHGGPARLLIPHLYLWKSAKWVRGIRLTERDVPGFWERHGYNNYGDPWQEQRYQGD